MNPRALLLAVGVLAVRSPRQGGPERVVLGRWRVTGWRCPAQCAIGRAQADAWKGRSALYTDSLVRVGPAVCRGPRYRLGYWTAEGVYGGARLQDLGIRADSTPVVEVRCPSQTRGRRDPRWPVWGAFLIVGDPDHLLVVWEGAFFELTRTRQGA